MLSSWKGHKRLTFLWTLQMSSFTLIPPVLTALVSFRNPKVNRSTVPSAVKENPSLEVFKVSYLWVEAYLTDIAGDDWSLCLHHRRPKGVRHHSFLDGVHLRTDNPEVTSKIQQHRRSSERLSSYCGWERNVKGKVQVNDRGCRWGGRKLGDKKSRVNCRGSRDWCGQEGVCSLSRSCCCQILWHA